MKLHKFTIVALFIWIANSIYGIKTKSFRPYFWALILFSIVLLFESCSSSGWSCKKRYTNIEKEKSIKPLA